MPDRELPDDLKARLSAELIAGTPLQAPLASQARYATAAAAGEREGFATGHRWATAGVAALTLLLLTLVAVPPILHTVGNRGHNVVTPLTTATPSVSEQPAESPTPASTSPSPEPSESPEPSDTPGSHESPEPEDSPQPVQSPQPHESPEPSSSPQSGSGDHGGSSPSPSPSPTND